MAATRATQYARKEGLGVGSPATANLLSRHARKEVRFDDVAIESRDYVIGETAKGTMERWARSEAAVLRLA